MKNIKIIAGKPLIYWVVSAAVESNIFDRIYVATDSEKIKNVVNSFNIEKVEVINRHPDTATDTAPSESALIEFCENNLFEYVFFIQATSPLLTSDDLKRANILYRESDFDSLLSVVEQKKFIWTKIDDGSYSPLNYSLTNRPRRQDFKGFLVENGAFYVSKRTAILNSKCRISGRIGTILMPEETYYEIDELFDWVIIEEMLIRRNKKNIKTLNIKMLVMDCDGVMTDAGMYYSENGEAFKKFNTRDGKAIELLKKNDIKSAIVTSESTLFAKRRAEKIGIDHLIMGASDKGAELRKLSVNTGIELNEIAYIGDDINDLPAIRLCALTACPLNAMPEVKNEVDFVLSSSGGNGAIREFVEMLLNG